MVIIMTRAVTPMRIRRPKIREEPREEVVGRSEGTARAER